MDGRRRLLVCAATGLVLASGLSACASRTVPGTAGAGPSGTVVQGGQNDSDPSTEPGKPSEPAPKPEGQMYDVPGDRPGPLAADAPLVTQSDKETRVLADADALRGLLDEFWTAELAASGLVHDPPDRYEYYRTTGNSSCGAQAEALPKNAYYCTVNGDEYVAFDLDWLTGYLDAHPGNATTFLILAHEWGHAVQDAWTEQQPGTDVWNPAYLQELNADCLAGVFLADAFARGTVIEEQGDASAIYGWLNESGSGEWTNPGDHGTPEQRQQAFDLGFNQGSAFCRQNV